jgi:hypothetical protein
MTSVSNKTSYFRQAHKIIPDVIIVITATVLICITVYMGKLLTTAPIITISDYIQLLILVFIAGTMCVGIWVQRRNEAFARSHSFLENALSLIAKAKDVLTNPDGSPTNDRISWVTAARLLTRAQTIASQITAEPHRIIYEAEYDYQRHCFGDLLRHNGEPLTASFFCGAHDPSKPIGDVVYDASQKKDGQNWIPTRIVAVVYRFFQYPEGYEDPLDKSIHLSQREIERLWLFDQKGVCDYFTFRNHFIPVGSKIKQANPNSGLYQEVAAIEITQQMDSLSGTVE